MPQRSHDPIVAGSAIVMDARTGGIVAMTSYPTFDPREFVGGVSLDYWEFVNENGGIAGRDVVPVILDSGHATDKAIEN